MKRRKKWGLLLLLLVVLAAAGCALAPRVQKDIRESGREAIREAVIHRGGRLPRKPFLFGGTLRSGHQPPGLYCCL